jgi:hypothetical protein
MKPSNLICGCFKNRHENNEIIENIENCNLIIKKPFYSVKFLKSINRWNEVPEIELTDSIS